MKPKDFIKKYFPYEYFDKESFNSKEFMTDFSTVFADEIDKRRDKNGNICIKGFEASAQVMRSKWNAINNRLTTKMDEQIWKYFWAAYVASPREELFPEELKIRREEKEKEHLRRQREEEMYNRYNRRHSFSDFFKMFYGFMAYMSGQLGNTRESNKSNFEFMGLDYATATEDDIKSKYKTLSKKYHPDLGGDSRKFLKLTEAKNSCLACVKGV